MGNEHSSDNKIVTLIKMKNGNGSDEKIQKKQNSKRTEFKQKTQTQK